MCGALRPQFSPCRPARLLTFPVHHRVLRSVDGLWPEEPICAITSGLPLQSYRSRFFSGNRTETCANKGTVRRAVRSQPRNI
jgi:hypothetical protein